MEQELVKMSRKGQLVVPKEIREEQHFGSKDRFVAFGIEEGVIFKKVEIPDVKAEFESISKKIENRFKKKDVEKKDIEKAVKWARKK